MDVLLAGMYHTIEYDRHSFSGSPVVNAAGTRLYRDLFFITVTITEDSTQGGGRGEKELLDGGGVISPALTVTLPEFARLKTGFV